MESKMDVILDAPPLTTDHTSFACLFCGAKGKHVSLDDVQIRFLVATRTLPSSELKSTRSACAKCLEIIGLMEKASGAQAALVAGFQHQSTKRLNGHVVKSESISSVSPEALVAPGSDVNMYQPPDISEDEDDGLGLVISDVRGNLPADEWLAEDPGTQSVGTDTCDLVEKLILCCEIYEETREMDSIVASVYSSFKSHDSTFCQSSISDTSHSTMMTKSSGSGRLHSLTAWTCSMCRQTCSSSTELVEHVRGAHCQANDGTFECPFCPKQFNSFTQLDDHISKLHSDGSNSCSECFTVFSRPSQLRVHSQSCAYPKSVINDSMTKSMVQLTTQTPPDDPPGQHLDVESSFQKNTCPICLVTFTSAEKVGQHVDECHGSAKAHTCSKCQGGFDTLRQLLSHTQVCQAGKNSENTFSCSNCAQSFSSWHTYKEHRDSCGTIAPSTSETSVISTRRCLRCPPADAGLEEKEQHEAMCGREAVDDHGAEFPCDLCDMSLPCQSTRNVHRNIHHGLSTKQAVTEQATDSTETVAEFIAPEPNTNGGTEISNGPSVKVETVKTDETAGNGETAVNGEIAVNGDISGNGKMAGIDKAATVTDKVTINSKQSISALPNCVVKKEMDKVTSSDLSLCICTLCSQAFIFHAELEEHQMTCNGVAGPPTTRCPYCLLTFERVQDIRKHIDGMHMMTNFGFTCQTCRAGFTRHAKHTFEDHLRFRCVRRELLQKGIEELCKPFRCPNCGVYFLSYASSLQHTAACNVQSQSLVEADVKPEIEVFTETKVNDVKIPVSDMNLVDVKTEPQSTCQAEPVFPCTICPREFLNRETRDRHFFIHQEWTTKQHQCVLCLAGFTTPPDSHQKLCPYRRRKVATYGEECCEVCGDPQPDLFHLRGHQEWTTKALICFSCDWGCQTEQTMAKHLSSRHSDLTKGRLKGIKLAAWRSAMAAKYPSKLSLVENEVGDSTENRSALEEALSSSEMTDSQSNASLYKHSCPVCFMDFKTESVMKTHMNDHDVPTRITEQNIMWTNNPPTDSHCQYCLISCSKPKQHAAKCHFSVNPAPDYKFQCMGCLGQYQALYLGIQHMEKCEILKRKRALGCDDTVCGFCLIPCKSMASVRKHVESFHLNVRERSQYKKCQGCNGYFNVRTHGRHREHCGLLRHTKNLPIVTSVLGDDSSTETESQAEPFTNTMDSAYGEKNGHPDDSQYLCIGCNAFYERREEVIKHMFDCEQLHLLGQGRASAPELPNDFEVDSNKQFDLSHSCLICGEDFLLKKDMEQHVLNQHENAASKPFKCNDCCAGYSLSQALELHKDKCRVSPENVEQKDEKPQRYQCAAEQEEEEEVEEWKCLSCSVRYKDELSFLLHIASHEVASVDKCVLCGGKFNCAADICMHMVKYHKRYLTTSQAGEQDFIPMERRDEKSVTVIPREPTPPPQEKASPPTKSKLKGNSPARNTPPAKVAPPAKKTAEGAGETDPGRGRSKYKHELLTGMTKCPVCQRSFTSLAQLRRHYGIHDGFYGSVCLVCGLGFINQQRLRQHRSTVHKTASQDDFVCDRCDGVCMTSNSLTVHKQGCLCPRHEDDMQCFFCTRTFPDWQKFKSHVWTHLTKCGFCDEKFPEAAKRTVHMKHCPKNPLLNKAPVKKKSSKTEEAEVMVRSLRVRLSTTPKPEDDPKPEVTVLEIPPKPKTSKPAPAKQLTPPSVFKCSECCGVFKTRVTLKSHMEKQHSGADYRCRVCGGRFGTLLAKNRHMIREHGSGSKMIKAAKSSAPAIKEKSDPEPETPAPESQPSSQVFYFCDRGCTLCFLSRAEKEKHIEEHHSEKSVKSFDCKFCDKLLPSKFARRRHIQKYHPHGGSTTTQAGAVPSGLACHICSKRFASNFARAQHLKRMHGMNDDQALSPPPAQPLKRVCKVCDARFAHKSELRAHRKAEHSEIVMDDMLPDALGNTPTKAMPVAPNPEPELPSEDRFQGARSLAAFSNEPVFSSDLHDHLVQASNPEPPQDDPLYNDLPPPGDEAKGGALSWAKPQSVMLPSASSGFAVPQPIRVTPPMSPPVKRKHRQCKDCNQSFDSKSELKAHRKTVHKEKKRTVITLMDDLDLTTKNVIIDLTDEPSEAPPAAKKPRLSAEAVDPTKPHHCSLCQKAFKMRMALKQHMSKCHVDKT